MANDDHIWIFDVVKLNDSEKFRGMFERLLSDGNIIKVIYIYAFECKYYISDWIKFKSGLLAFKDQF